MLGTAAVAHVTPDNPFGLNPRDPYGRDDILVETNELHLPLGRPVKMVLRSKDVLHDFYVPQFRAKMDLVPGIVTYFWLTPTVAGNYRHPLRRAVRRRPSPDARHGGRRAPGRRSTAGCPSR